MSNVVSGSIVIGTGGLSVGTDTGTGVVYLTASGAGTITETTNTDIVTAGTVNLASGSSDIGGSGTGNAFITDAGSLSVNTKGNAYLSNINTNGVNLNASSVGASDILTLTSANGINVVGLVTAGTDSGTGSINLTTSGAGVMSAGSGSKLEAGTVTLTTIGTDIGSNAGLSAPMYVDAANVNLNTGGVTGSAYVYDSSTGNITITNANVGIATGDTFAFVGVNSSTTSINTASGLVLTVPTVIIGSVYGNIGTSSTNAFNIDSNNVTLSAGLGNVYANDSATGNIALANVSALGMSLGNIASTTSGVYDFNASSLTAGNITTASGASIMGNSVNLVTANGSIGASGVGNALSLIASNLTMQAVNGSAYATDSLSVNLGVSSTNNLNVTESGANATLNVSGNLTASNVVLSTTVNGNISIAANIGGVTGDAASVSLNANGSGNITEVLGTPPSPSISTTSLTLVSGSGNIGTNGIGTQAIQTDAGTLSANTTGNVSVTDSNATNVSLNASSGTNFTLSASGSATTLTVTQALTASGNVDLNTTTNGNIVIANVISGLGGADATIVSLNANGTGNIVNEVNASNPVVLASTVSLTSGSGNIGSTGVVGSQAIQTDAINVNANTTGNVYVSDNNTVMVNLGVSSGNSFNVTATGSNANLNVNGVVSATNVNLITTNNGNIIIDANIGGVTGDANSVMLNANGSGAISEVLGTPPSASINATTLTMVSGSGNIGNVGTGTQAINTDATNLSANTTGNVNVIDSNVSNVNLNASTGNVFTLTASGSNTNLNVLGALAANTVNLNTTTNGNINIANVISAAALNDANTINLTANGSGNIVNQVNSSNPRLLAQNVNLVSGTGNIGSTGVTGASSINTDALIFTVNTAGNAYVTDTNSPAATIGNSTANNFVVNTTTNGANIQVSGTVNAAAVDFTTNSGNIITTGNMNISNAVNFNTNGSGGITINSKVGSSTSNDTLTSSNYGYIVSGTKGLLIGNALSLVSNLGEIGYGVGGLTPFMTQANNLVFSAALSVGIYNNSNSLNIAASGSGANLYVENTGGITASGMISAPVLGLYSFGGSGVGSSSNIIQVNAVNIGMQALGAGGNVYVNDTYAGSTVLQASQASNILKLDTAGPLTIYALINQGGVVSPGIIGGSIIAIQTLSGYGIYNAANIVANDFIFLTASQNGYIAEPLTGALMYAPNVSLVSGGGAIGAGPVGSRLLVNSANVSASTQGLNSFVNIYDEAANSGIVGGQSGSYFTFNTNGNVNIYGGIGTGAGAGANGGAINITANGILNVGVNGTGIPVTTNNGPIVVIDNNPNAGAINFAKGDFVYTNTAVGNPGYIVFNVGPYAQTNTVNPNPANISATSSGGATIFYGVHGIAAPVGGNVLNAKGQSIVFNTSNLPASAITLGGNVSIIADPPVATSAVAAIQNNIATANGYTESANTQATNNNQSVVNVLDNNQATMNTSNSNNNIQDNENNETRYLSNNDDNSELVDNASLIMPIAYNHESQSLTAEAINANNGFTVSNVANGQTSGLTFTAGSYNNANLGQGSAIIRATHDMVVTLGQIKPVKLSLKRGAIVLAIANGGVVSIFNLHDNAAGSVVVKANGIKAITLAPGRHVSVASAHQAIDFAYINQVRKIGYRGIKANTSNGVATYVSDFSIPSAISVVKPLKAMFRSNDKQVKALANQLLKTSVVVTQSTSGSGVYEQVAKPKLTAMRQISR